MAKYTKQISVGYDKTGKRIRKWARGDTKAELNQNIYELKKKYEKGAPNNITFGEYSKQWLNTYKSLKSPRTYEMYEYILRKFEDINHLQLSAIKRTDIQNIIAQNKDYPNLCKKIKTCLNQIFNSAIADGIEVINPTSKLEMPKKRACEKRALTSFEKETISNMHFSDPKKEVFIKTILNFGLRPGEMLALDKDCFNLENNILTIKSAVTFVSNAPILKGTKTGAIRKLPIPNSLVPLYEEYLKDCDKYLFYQGNDKTKLMSKTAFKIFKKGILMDINERLGGSIKDDKLNGLTLYTFRHNKATALYYLDGLSIKAKAAYMGHSVQMLMNIYSHIDETKECTDVLSECVF